MYLNKLHKTHNNKLKKNAAIYQNLQLYLRIYRYGTSAVNNVVRAPPSKNQKQCFLPETKYYFRLQVRNFASKIQ
jgi:hypothetical protein